MTSSPWTEASRSIRCPVCSAAVRGSRQCGRCGADLTELLRVVVTAWRDRRDGWQRLADGDVDGASAAAARSGELSASSSARRLAWLARALHGNNE